jgi:phage gpG-like protein
LAATVQDKKVYQDFDLVEIFGQEVTPDVALAFGQALIDRMLERTSQNRAVDGSPLASYSDSYVKSLEFKAAGKSRNDPNMELSGGMLSAIDILQATPTSLRIGFNRQEEELKAFGHMTGMEGHPTLQGITPVREFFGITQSEISDIKGDFESQLELAVAGLTPLDETVRRFSIFDLLESIDD